MSPANATTPRPSRPTARGLAMALGVILAVLGWQEWRAWQTQAETVRGMVASLQEWNASTDAARRDQLEIQTKLRLPEIKDAALLARALPPSLSDTFLGEAALGCWREQDRLAALAWLAAQPNPPRHSAEVLLDGWVEQDPDGSHRYLDSLPAGAWKEIAISALVKDAMFHQRPQEAIALASRLPTDRLRAPLLEEAVLSWAHLDSATAIAWLEKQPASGSRGHLLAIGAIGYAFTDPRAAAEWLIHTPPPNEDFQTGLTSILRTWRDARGLEEPAKWAAQLPDASLRIRATAILDSLPPLSTP